MLIVREKSVWLPAGRIGLISDTHGLIRPQALKALQIDDSYVQPRAALSRISHAKNRMETPEQMADSAVAGGWNRRDEQIAKVYTRYVAAFKPVIGDQIVAGGALDEQLQFGLGVRYAH